MATQEEKIGYGDELIATGMARGARARGKRIAFGDGRRIIWGPHCGIIFRNNPNIAPPGSERLADIEWVKHYKGNRLYVRTHNGSSWCYDRNFKIVPGEMFFDGHEREFATNIEPGFVLIEPYVKSVYPNKQWPLDRYKAVAAQLLAAGYRVAQFVYDQHSVLCTGITPIRTSTIRLGLVTLARARLIIGAEGALIHGAAAVGIPAVVLFGGFTDPRVLGYVGNANLTGGAEPCGSVARCGHCQIAMANITVDHVMQNALGILNAKIQSV